MKLTIKTEERPKLDTVRKVLNIYLNQKNISTLTEEVMIEISPIILNSKFTFKYQVIVKNFYGDFNKIISTYLNDITLEIVSGSSSFIDYLVFENSTNLVAMIEETKTDDSESRNTGVYQRASKFVYANILFPDINKYMLYTNQSSTIDKSPSNTAIFGTRLLKTIGVKIIGKNEFYNSLTPFYSVSEIIDFKNNKMRRPPVGNTPILISNFNDCYEISGILSKPSSQGNIAHDPNIGALSLISAAIRIFDNRKPIYITKHLVSQNFIERASKNKFLYIASKLNIYLKNLTYSPINYNYEYLKNKYYHVERSSEKITTIFLHVLLENYIGSKLIYENHAGCERGYFYTPNSPITLPKKINNAIFFIPDLVLKIENKILIIEGKKLSRVTNGIEELSNYGLFSSYCYHFYGKSINIEKWVTTFGGQINYIFNKEVLLHINLDGSLLLNENCPYEIKDVFKLFY